MNNLISVIIVNYNGADFIGESIESIINQTYNNWEIIVLDNNSSDNSVEIIKRYPSVKLIESKINHGFAKGNNIAIREAGGKYIALLNNDATAEASWLESMVKFLDHNEEYGSCGCKIISYYEQKYLDSAGLLISPSGMSRARGRNESIHDYNTSEPILIPSGCAAMYRKKALDEVGLFDEDFFCYCEDTDLGFRLQIAGWKCFYVSEAVVYHRYSSTTGKYSLFKTYLVERNHYWFVIKNFPISLVLMNPIHTIRLYFHQLLNMFNQKGATSELMSNTSTKKLILTLLKAHKDVWKMLFVMLKKRSTNNKLKKVDNRQIKEWIKQYNISVADLFKS